MEKILKSEAQYQSKSYKNRLYVLNETNLYKILGIPEESSLEDISKAYRIVAKELHPDVNHNLLADEKKQAGAIFQKITSAFNILKDSEERRNYDLELQNQRYREESLKKINESKEKEKQGSIVFTFKQVKFVDLEKVREEQKKAEEQKALETFNKAKSLIESEKFDAAYEILRVLVESVPDKAIYHSYLGLALNGKGWHGYAQAEFKVALHYNPNDEVAKEHYKQPVVVSPQIVKKSTNTTTKNDEVFDPTSTSNLREILSKVKSIFAKK